MRPAAGYRCHEPEKALLCRVVQENLETFLQAAMLRDPRGVGLPRYVELTFRRFHAVKVDGGGGYLIEASRHPADPTRLSGRWCALDRPRRSSRWEGRVVDPRRIDGQVSGMSWDFRR